MKKYLFLIFFVVIASVNTFAQMKNDTLFVHVGDSVIMVVVTGDLISDEVFIPKIDSNLEKVIFFQNLNNNDSSIFYLKRWADSAKYLDDLDNINIDNLINNKILYKSLVINLKNNKRMDFNVDYALKLRWLLQIDQKYRSQIPTHLRSNKDTVDKYMRMQKIGDSISQEQFKDLILQYGFPKKTVLSISEFNYFMILLLHSNHDFKTKYKKDVYNAYKEKYCDAELYAMFEDKYRLESGVEQMYGTQIIPNVTYTKEQQQIFEKNAKEIGYDKKHVNMVNQK